MRKSSVCSFTIEAKSYTRKLYRAFSARLLSNWYGASEKKPASPLMGAGRMLSSLYLAGLKSEQARLLKKQVRLPAYVVSIGNLAVGGTGKTPLAIWICQWLLGQGTRPAILSRGYGRGDNNPAQVPASGDPEVLAKHFGDEPVLMARVLPAVPVWVGGRRAVAGKAAVMSGGADILVMDDGFQHLLLARDLDIVLLDCRNPFGNGLTLPAGPLREPVINMERADAFVLTHADSGVAASRLEARLGELFPEKPVFTCRHVMNGFWIPGSDGMLPFAVLGERPAIAFAGLARPEGFFEDLAGTGTNMRGSIAFPDHHRYTESDFLRIYAEAVEKGARVIITTAKDAVRIPAPYRDSILIAGMRIEFGRDKERFCGFLKKRLGSIPAASQPTPR